MKAEFSIIPDKNRRVRGLMLTVEGALFQQVLGSVGDNYFLRNINMMC